MGSLLVTRRDDLLARKGGRRRLTAAGQQELLGRVRVLGEERGRAAFLAGAIEGDAAQALGLRGGREFTQREGRVGCGSA